MKLCGKPMLTFPLLIRQRSLFRQNDLSRDDSTVEHRFPRANKRSITVKKVNENYAEPRGVSLVAHTREIGHCVKL